MTQPTHICPGCLQSITTPRCVLVASPSGRQWWHTDCRRVHLMNDGDPTAEALVHDRPFTPLGSTQAACLRVNHAWGELGRAITEVAEPAVRSAYQLAEFCRAAMAMQGQPTGFRRVDHSVVDEWCDDENPFTDPNPRERKASPPCPNCGSRTETAPDYGIISWPDDIIPTHVKDAMARGETPFACTACGHGWNAPWD